MDNLFCTEIHNDDCCDDASLKYVMQSHSLSFNRQMAWDMGSSSESIELSVAILREFGWNKINELPHLGVVSLPITFGLN